MVKLFGILILSFLFTLILALPFINLLYRLKFQRQDEKPKDIFDKDMPIFWRLHGWKKGTPTGGGILVIAAVLLLSVAFYLFTSFSPNNTSTILFFTVISFGFLGFYDDIQKIFGWKKTGFWGLQVRYKLIIQLALSFLISYYLYFTLNITGFSIPLIGSSYFLNLGFSFIPFSMMVITFMTNAYNITDGLDGLAVGLLIITLAAFWHLNTLFGYGDIAVFITTLLGSLLAFLYFNIYPARVWLGDTGAMSFGALLVVIALILDQLVPLFFIGFVFIIEAFSTLLQWSSKAWFRKKVFLCAPLHHHFEALGWDETKVTMRFWLLGAVCAFIGIFFALLPSLKF